jgi:ribosome-associated heat shock protein Hsp15
MTDSGRNDSETGHGQSRIRLDRWLWAARFFKTRSAAHTAITGGKVDINGVKAKPASRVGPGDRLRITKGQQLFEVNVLAISENRGPARQAQALYDETEASRSRRADEAAARRATRDTTPIPRARPARRDRRALRRFKRKR